MNRIKEKIHMVTSTDTGKTFNQQQHTRTHTISKGETGGNF